MTPRLKFLSLLLALSIGYAIYDYIARNSDKKDDTRTKKVVKKRARTAGVSAQRGLDVQARIEARKKLTESKIDFVGTKEFLPIADNISDLDGWSRNPFVDVYEPPKISKRSKATPKLEIEKLEIEINDNAVFSNLDGLIIETAVRMGEKAFVTINGQTFTEGDLINDALIEKIENEQITFKVGKTRIIKDVGT